MRIAQLHAENFKRLGVVEITPEGNLVTIGGKNGHGKSSVLDAIYVALKGRAVAPPRPIRKGAERATIRLDMGELIVTRSFIQKEGETYTDNLRIERANGDRVMTRPQDVLDALLGEIGFDPFAFTRLKPDEQAAKLLEMVPLTIDLDEYAEKDASDFSKRTEVNRDVGRFEAQLAGLPEEQVPENAPDRDALQDQLANAAETNSGIERERVAREQETTRIERGREFVDQQREQAANLRREADELEQKAATTETQINEAAAALESRPALADPVDTADLRRQLAEAEETQRVIDRQARRKEIAGELAAAQAESKRLTDAMAAREAERNEALAAAELPVEGLAFGVNEKGKPVLTYDGLPFHPAQISTAVQLRVSTAIGMASNPHLRVLRISDGSLLDSESMAMLGSMAEAEDFQVWVEVVDEGEGVGIIMENGEVRGAGNQDDSTESTPAPAAKPKGKAKPADDGKLL